MSMFLKFIWLLPLVLCSCSSPQGHCQIPKSHFWLLLSLDWFAQHLPKLSYASLAFTLFSDLYHLSLHLLVSLLGPICLLLVQTDICESPWLPCLCCPSLFPGLTFFSFSEAIFFLSTYIAQMTPYPSWQALHCPYLCKSCHKLKYLCYTPFKTPLR